MMTKAEQDLLTFLDSCIDAVIDGTYTVLASDTSYAYHQGNIAELKVSFSLMEKGLRDELEDVSDVEVYHE